MKAGIIAAGKGERLSLTGAPVPKPLVPILGEPMIARTIRALDAAGVDEVCCVINGLDPSVGEYLRSRRWPVPFRIVERATGNSLESFSLLVPFLEKEPFLIFTVDAVFRFSGLRRFLAATKALPGAEAVLAVTRFADDETPLSVRVDRSHVVREIGSKACSSPFVTAGFYWFRPTVLQLLNEAKKRELNAFRHFLCLIPESGYPTYAIAVSRTFDVDRREDIEKAEQYLGNEWETYS
jgi:NDP-sugar pyrophosphorylase family protein